MLQELKEKRAKLIKFLDELRGRWETELGEAEKLTTTAIEENRGQTEDEAKAWTAAIEKSDATHAEIKRSVEDEAKLGEQIATLEAVEAARAANPPSGVPSGAPGQRTANPWDFGEFRYGQPAEDLRGRLAAALETEKSVDGDAIERTLALVARVDGSSSHNPVARHALACGHPDYRSGFAKVLSGANWDITPAEAQAITQARANSLTDADGGFAVPTLLDPTIISTREGSTNPFRGLAREVQIAGDNWNGITSAGITVSWDGEAQEVSDDAPTLDPVRIEPHKAQGFVPFSIEIGMDWANMESDIRTMFQDAKDDEEARVFAVGAAANEPTGIVTALLGGPSVVPTAGVGAVTRADITNLDSQLGDRYRQRAQFVAHHAVYNHTRDLDSAAGASIWSQLAAGQPATLLGYNTNQASAMDSAIATGSEVMVFGDFQNYVIVNRVGMSVELVPHLFGAANRPTGQRGLYTFWRVGADSVNDAAFRMLQVG